MSPVQLSQFWRASQGPRKPSTTRHAWIVAQTSHRLSSPRMALYTVKQSIFWSALPHVSLTNGWRHTVRWCTSFELACLWLHFEPLCIVYAGHARRWQAYTWTMEQPCPSCLSDSSKAYFYSYSLLRRLSFPYLHTERVTTKCSSSSSSSSSSSFLPLLLFS